MVKQNKNNSIPLDKFELSRRNVFTIAGFGLAFLSFAGIIGATIRFIFPNVLYEPIPIVKLGKISDFPDDSLTFNEAERLYVLRKNNKIRVVSAVCPHLGCTINWSKINNIFECPCHGSFFSKDGVVLSGPAPRPMQWIGIKKSSNKDLIANKKNIVSKDFFLKV